MTRVGIVAIGRNEGARLERCLASCQPLVRHVVYEHLGDVYRAQGRVQSAMAAYERGLALAGDAEARSISAKLQDLRLRLEQP